MGQSAGGIRRRRGRPRGANRVAAAAALAAALTAALALGGLAPSSAQAKRAHYIVGMGEQNPAMFTDPNFQALGIRRVHLNVPYDVATALAHPSSHAGWEQRQVDLWLAEAKRYGAEVLVAFERSTIDPRHLPTVDEFAEAFAAFRARYPWVQHFSTWNEANHKRQPTWRNPRRVARYYNFIRRSCPECRVVAVDLLSAKRTARWVRRFRRVARPRPRLWGLHNYKDANKGTGHRWRTSKTRRFLRIVRGKVWLTETGGIVRFRDKPRYNRRRATRAVRRVFRLARRSRRIKRVYFYHWQAQADHPTWDSGFIGPSGKPRPAYRVLLRKLPRVRL